MNVRFLVTCSVLDAEKAEAERYEAGEVYDLSPRSAERWVRRSRAEYVPSPGAAAEAIPPASPAVARGARAKKKG